MAGICEGEWMGRSPGHEPLTLTRCHICEFPKQYETLGWKSVCDPAYNLKGIKEKFPFLSQALFLFYCSSFHAVMRADPAVAGGGNNNK